MNVKIQLYVPSDLKANEMRRKGLITFDKDTETIIRIKEIGK